MPAVGNSLKLVADNDHNPKRLPIGTYIALVGGILLPDIEKAEFCSHFLHLLGMLLLYGFQCTRESIGASPGLNPYGTGVAAVQKHLHDAAGAVCHLLHLPFGIHIAKVAAAAQELGRRIAPVVLFEIGINLGISAHHGIHPVVSGPFVATPMVLGTAGHNSFHIPLVAVEQEAHERALVVNFAVSGHYHARPGGFGFVFIARRKKEKQQGCGKKGS